MNDLQIFENPEFGSVRTVEVNGTPWWLARMLPQRWGIRIRNVPSVTMLLPLFFSSLILSFLSLGGSMDKLILIIKILVTEQKVKFYTAVCRICEKIKCRLSNSQK